MEQLQLPYLVKLQVYEGPLDLLLQLIKKNEVDIYEIPIAKITRQYFEYLEVLKKYDLSVVGSYMALAAQLSLIKSRMLLPNPPSEEEEEDPHSELVRRLLEYEKYKEATEELEKKNILGKEVFVRGLSYAEEFGEIAEETEIAKTDLWSLMTAFREVCKRKNFDSTEEEIVYNLEMYSIEQKANELLNFIKFRGQIRFKNLFSNLISKSEFVITFLAVLEMVKNNTLCIVQEDCNSEVELVYLGNEIAKR